MSKIKVTQKLTKKSITQEQREEMEKKWMEADLSNDFLFGQVVSSEEIYPDLIKAITKDTIGKNGKAVVQKSAKVSRFSKASRFDVWVETRKKVYDMEMQNTLLTHINKRIRYYASNIDMEAIKEGMHYTMIKDSAVTFVVKEDPYDKGLPIYTFENTCNEEKGLKLNDGCVKIILNASEYNKLENGVLKVFLKVVMGEEDNSMFGKKLINKIKAVKECKKAKGEYMSMCAREMDYLYEGELKGIEKGMEKGMEKGIAKGMEKTKKENAIALLDILDNKTISEKLKIDIKSVEELRKKNTK